MKITLINVPASRVRYNISGTNPMLPLGIAYIGSVLEKNGYRVNIIDMQVMNISIEQLRDLIYDEGGDIFGISCSLFSLRQGIRVSKIIKGIKPESIIILGGACTVFSPTTILRRVPEIDIIVKGEGESTVLELVKEIKKGNPYFKNINGIIYREGEQIIETAERIPIKNLDELPLPARHLFPIHRYRIHPPYGLHQPVITMETSRGCPFNCTFCCAPAKFRHRNPKNIVDEIEFVVKEYGVKEIYFVDSTFGVIGEMVDEMCKRIVERDLDVTWTCGTRVDLMSEKLIKQMKKAGCYMISYGVESGSQRILDSMKKGITRDQIEKTIKLTKEANIRSVVYLIVGTPGETYDDVKETIKFVKKIEPDFVVYTGFTPTPSTEAYQKAIAEKIIDSNYYENLIFSEHDLSWPLYATEDLPRKKIIQLVKEGYRKFYFRPKYWFRRLFDIKNFNDAKNLVRGLGLIIADHLLLKSDIIKQ